MDFINEEINMGAIEADPLPFLAIETAAGSGSEISLNAVMQVEGVKAKTAIHDPRIIPEIAILDPEMTVSMPKGLTSGTGLDALTHIMEGALSRGANPIGDAHAYVAAQTIPKYLPQATYNPKDIEARSQMLFQSMVGGYSLNYCDVNEGHMVSHVLGREYHMSHGVAQGLVLPYCSIGYNIPVFPEKVAKIAENWWGMDVSDCSVMESCRRLLDATVELLDELDKPWKLSQIDGVEEDDLPELANTLATEPAIQIMDMNTVRDKSEEDYLELLQRMYDGRVYEF